MYAPPEEVEPAGVLDGDIIAGSTGTRILVRQAGGDYLEDTLWSGQFGVSPAEWRTGALELVALATEHAGIKPRLSAIEHPDNYEAGTSDVFPPD